MKRLLIILVRIYQWTLSPMLRMCNGGAPSCRHEPSCSNYAIDALRTHGAIRGCWLSLRRLLRCHPWGTFGYDPVPPPRRTQNHICAKHCCDSKPH